MLLAFIVSVYAKSIALFLASDLLLLRTIVKIPMRAILGALSYGFSCGEVIRNGLACADSQVVIGGASMANPIQNDDDDLQAWLDAENERADAEARERERLHIEALRRFNFEHAKFNFKRQLYAKAIGAGNA